MKKTLLIFFMLLLAGCSSTPTNTGSNPETNTSSAPSRESQKVSGVVKVNSYVYEVTATKFTGALTDMEDVRQQAFAEARTFCAKDGVGMEVVNLVWLYEDLANPAKATLRFRCIGPIKQEPPQNAN